MQLSNFLSYTIKRILNTLPIIIIVTVISFFLVRLSPIDPLAQLKMNPAVSQDTIEKETKRLALDKPIIIQYTQWAKSFLKGNMGFCLDNSKVSTKIKSRLINTLILSLNVVFFSWVTGMLLGVIAAVNYNTWIDKILTFLTSAGMAVPSFFLAILLLLFAQKTGLFPLGGLTSIGFDSMTLLEKIKDVLWHLFLPTLTLTTISVSSITRQMRSNMLDILDSEYIKFAYAKGLNKNKVIFKHAIRNAINPIITLLGFEFAGLLSGAVLTEYVFQYPGLGKLMLDAIMQSDINLIMASLVIGTFMLILGNLLADIFLKITDPRIKI